MKIKNFDYDENSDSLIITKKQDNEKVHGSAEIGNLILDFTSDGKIISIEVQSISKFLEMMNINPEMLNELTEADLTVQKQKDAVLLFAVLKTPKLVQPLPLSTIPISRRLSSSV